MASVTYGKCNLWQKYYVKCNYGKNIMANETEPFFYFAVQYQVWSMVIGHWLGWNDILKLEWGY